MNEQDSNPEQPVSKPTSKPTSITTVQAEYRFSGPLPPPEVLARYNEIIPNGAERILAMVERQSAHRESVEARAITANITAQQRGTT